MAVLGEFLCCPLSSEDKTKVKWKVNSFMLSVPYAVFRNLTESRKENKTMTIKWDVLKRIQDYALRHGVSSS